MPHGVGERSRLGLTELADRQLELFLAGADGVVEVREHLTRPRVEHLDGLRGQLVDRQFLLAQGLDAVVDTTLLAAPGVEVRAAAAEDGHAADDAGCDQAGVVRIECAGQSVDRRQARTCPVLVAQLRDDVVVRDFFECRLIEAAHAVGCE